MDKISTLCYYAIMTIDWKLIKNQLSQRKPICLYDFPDRENETDVLYIGNPVDAQTVNFLRKEVGGPLAIYLSGQFFKRLGILAFTDFIKEANTKGIMKR